MSFASNWITLFVANRFDSSPMANAVSTLTYAALGVIILPLSVCLMYGAYQDLRLRRNDTASSA